MKQIFVAGRVRIESANLETILIRLPVGWIAVLPISPRGKETWSLFFEIGGTSIDAHIACTIS